MTRPSARYVTACLVLAIGTTAVGLCTPRHAGAVDTDIAISTTAIDFGQVNVGSTAQVSVTLTNTGGDPFGPINMFGGAPPTAEFNASQNCQATTLPAGGSCMVNYSFSPGATGTFNDTSSFTVSETPNQADGEDFSVSLTGVGFDPNATTSTSTTAPSTTVSTTSTTESSTTVTTTTTTESSTTESTTSTTESSTTVTTTTTTGLSTIPSTTTTTAGSSSTVSTLPLPACDPTDCDGDACTVGDVCVGVTCSAGTRLTAGQLGGLVREAAIVANAGCFGNRGRSLNKVVRRLTRAARLLGQAEVFATEAKRRKKLSQAQRAVDRASLKLEDGRSRLAPDCATALDAAIASARTGLSCLP